MNLIKSKDLYNIILLIAAIVVLFSCLSFFALSTQQDAVYAENFTSEWKNTNVEVHNNVNDYVFTVPASIRYDVTISSYRIRIKASDVQDKYSYFLLPGYTNGGLVNFTLDDNQEYYTYEVAEIEGFFVSVQYTAKTNTITFVDSMTNETIQTYTVSTSQNVVAPKAPEHTGYTFVGWSGGEYENVTRSAYIYAVYAPTRVVTVLTPDDQHVLVDSYYGASIEDVLNALNYQSEKAHYWFKCVKDENGNKISTSTVITDDCSITLCYTNTGNGYLWGLAWYWYIAIIVVVVIIVCIFINT